MAFGAGAGRHLAARNLEIGIEKLHDAGRWIALAEGGVAGPGEASIGGAMIPGGLERGCQEGDADRRGRARRIDA